MTSRQPAGIPTGGQFAAGSQGRADVALDQFAPTIQERVDQQRAKKAELAAAAAHFERMTAQTIADVIRERYPNADRLEMRRHGDHWRPGAVLDAEGNRIETVFDDARGDDTVHMLVNDLEHEMYRSAAITEYDDGHFIALDTRHGFWDEAVSYGPRHAD